MTGTLLIAVLTAASPGDAAASTSAFHEQRLASLKAPEGWLSVVGLAWFKEGENRAGAAPDSDLLCPAGWPAKLGVFTQAKTGVTFTPAVAVTVEDGKQGKPFAGGEIKVDAEGDSVRFATGQYRFNVIRRGNRTGLRLRDTQAPARARFTDVPMYPASAEWQVTAKFERTPGVAVSLQNILGQIQQEASPGTASFEVNGVKCRLVAITDDDGSLFFVFGDDTNADTTYGAGRFLNVPAGNVKDGSILLDFNQATNPPCAFTEFATCPLPPKGNRLPVRIEAGEKVPPRHPGL